MSKRPPVTDALAFRKAIIANPEDDLPRLVFADWLDEHGEHERAWLLRDPSRREFEVAPGGLTFRYGDSLSAACADELYRLFDEWGVDRWPGGIQFTVRRGFVDEVRCTLAAWCGKLCSVCNGRGHYCSGSCHGDPGWRSPGIGPDVVAAHPVRTVTPTDRGIAVYDATMEVWVLDYSALPDDVIALLPHKYARWVRPEVLYFESEQLAFAALSAALIAFARR